MEFAVCNPGVGDGCEFTAAQRTGEEMVFRSVFVGAHSVFDEVVVEFEAPVRFFTHFSARRPWRR